MSKVRYTVARKGTSLVLAATLATGMVPAIALAHDGGEPATLAAEQTSGEKELDLEVGKAYTVDVTWGSMAATYLDGTVQLVWDGSGYTIDVSSSMISFFGYFEVDGKRADLVTNDEGKQVFRVGISDLDEKECKTLVTMMGREVTFSLEFDTSTLPTKADAPASYEKGYTIYYKGEKYDASRQFQDKVKVTPKDGLYYVELTANSLGTAATLGDVTYDGKTVAKVTHEDGSATYTLPLPSIDSTYDFTFSYTITAMNRTNTHDFQLVLEGGTYSGDTVDPEPAPDEQKVDKTKLNEALRTAHAIEQGKKTAEAWAALQSAISTAEGVAANEKIPQAGVDGVTAQLLAAIDTFNSSANAKDPEPTPDPTPTPDPEPTPDPTPTPEPEPDPTPDPDPTPTPSNELVTTADGFKMVAGKEYALPVSFVNASTGAASSASAFMEASATVVYADGAYSVTVTPNAQGAQFLTAMAYNGKDAVKNADGSFTISGVSTIAKDITVSVTMPAGTVDMGVRLDTSSLATESGDPVTPDPVKPSTDGDNGNSNAGSDANNNNNGSGANNNGSTTVSEQANQGFQVGHTYQVPVSWLKHDSTEESMAAKYFGDTALVRPQSDGTFKVSFSATSEGDSHIVKLTYNNTDLSKSGSQYTLSTPKADADTVLPISMTIKEMEQLGGGAQVADMHLKLSQAKDLGTNQESTVASSSKTTSSAKTGDNAAGAAGAAAIAVAAAGAAVVARRRMQLR